MMHKRPRRFGIAFIGALLITGCAPKTTRLQIESFKQTPSQVYTEHFENGAYAADPQNNWDLVFEVPATWTPTTQLSPASQPEANQADAGEWSSQMLHIKVFWTPQPGRTYAESTQTNASIHYCLYQGSGTMCYEGAGFVYFRPPQDGKPFAGQLESATLNPVRSLTSTGDLFGPCRLTGQFVANPDIHKVVRSLQSVRRRHPPMQGPPR